MRAEPKKLKIAENAKEEIGIIEKMVLPVEKMQEIQDELEKVEENFFCFA